MTAAEAKDYLELRQRLYGGPLDGEPGDITTMKADIAAIKKIVNQLTGVGAFIKVASSFVTMGGFAMILRAIIGG